jgi:predicted ester cyclase
VQWIDPAAGGQLNGREAVRHFHREVMFRAIPDVRLRLIDNPLISDDGSSVAVRVAISGTMTGPLVPPGFAPTGHAIAFESAEFSMLRDGLLLRHTVVLDMLDLARQIGAVPRAGSLGDRVGRTLQHVTAWWMRR